MPPREVNRHLNATIRSAIYQMKRQYGGGQLDIYQLNGSTVDLASGQATIQKTLTQVDRAVVLPARVERSFIKSISMISADKTFVYGGTYDRDRRMFLVDMQDVPYGFELDEDDWVVYDGKKYEVKHFDEWEFDSLIVIIGHHVHGDVPEQIFLERAEDRITPTEEADG